MSAATMLPVAVAIGGGGVVAIAAFVLPSLSPLFLLPLILVAPAATSPTFAVVMAAASEFAATASAASANKCMHNSAPPSDELN